MPIPKPRDGESKKDFKGRCMSDGVMVEEYPDTKQRNAICENQWRKEHGGEKNEAPEQPGGLHGRDAPLPETPLWLRAVARGAPRGVDRERNIINGYSVAELGAFKSVGRGEFDNAALSTIVKLMNESPKGVKVRFTHPTLSNDGLGTFLGRAKNSRLDGSMVRADLHLDKTSFNTPNGDLGGYVMDLAESDPEAMSSSLVLDAEEEYRLERDGTPKKDKDGNMLPPLWRPTKIHASDIVDTGDAVHSGFLSAEGLADKDVRYGAALLDRVFAGQTRRVVRARAEAWLDRYLTYRFGEDGSSDGRENRILVDPQHAPGFGAIRERIATAREEARYLLQRRGNSA